MIESLRSCRRRAELLSYGSRDLRVRLERTDLPVWRGALPDNRSTPARRSGVRCVARNCCGRGSTDRTALPLSYRSTEAPGGIRTRDRRLGVDNRTRSGPQQVVRRGRGARSGCGVEPQRPGEPGTALTDETTEPLRPATICFQQVRQGSNPDQRGWSSPCYRLHHGPVKRTTRIERA